MTDFDTCSLPFKSKAWIWGVSVSVFGAPTVIIVVTYGLILAKVVRESEAQTEAHKATLVFSILTAAFLLCLWPECIYLAWKYKDSRDSRAFYFGILHSLLHPALFVLLNPPLRLHAMETFLPASLWRS